MGRAGGQFFGNGAAAGADFDHGASGEIAERGRNAPNGLRIVEKILSELGFNGHDSFDGNGESLMIDL